MFFPLADKTVYSMIDHIEFKLAVTVWSLEGPEYQPCPELHAICELIDAPTLQRSPAELFPSSNSIRSCSTTDPACFLNVDIRADPTDQMEVVSVQIRCCNNVADSIEELLQKIRSRSEVKTALLRGNLGLNVGAREA